MTTMMMMIIEMLIMMTTTKRMVVVVVVIFVGRYVSDAARKWHSEARYYLSCSSVDLLAWVLSPLHMQFLAISFPPLRPVRLP